jgi:hypothetical protein
MTDINQFVLQLVQLITFERSETQRQFKKIADSLNTLLLKSLK